MRVWLKALITALALFPAAAGAQCLGKNLYEAYPDPIKSELDARAAAAPFAKGNFWQASKGEQKLIILGTYHLQDPRHEQALKDLEPYWQGIAGLLVEGGPEEEAALRQAMTRNPDLIFIKEGPTLLEQLPKADWQRLAKAMEDRGMPSFLTAKMQPWYAAIMLGIAPCAMAQEDLDHGLDHLLIEAAIARDLPITALEPYDTLFKIFEDLSKEDILSMLKTSLISEEQSEDLSVTLGELYFKGESRLLWEVSRQMAYDTPHMTRETADAEMAKMEEVMMAKRNRAWIPIITKAAEAGPVLVAFGALHLSGEEGVLNLLKDDGWQLSPLF